LAVSLTKVTADQREAPQRPSGLLSKERFFRPRRPALLPFALFGGASAPVPFGVLLFVTGLPSQHRTERPGCPWLPFRRDLAVTRTRRCVRKPYSV